MKKPEDQVKRYMESGWEEEYRNTSFLTLSDESTQSVKDFFRYAKKHNPENMEGILADIGCGTGRHAMYASSHYGMYSFGFDISPTAIRLAQTEQKNREDVSASFSVWNVTSKIPLENAVCSLVLDATCSPSILVENIDKFWREVARITKHGGMVYSRQMILDGDEHAKFLLSKSPLQDAYIHPTLLHPERVETFAAINERFLHYFEILHGEKEYGYQAVEGKKYKRRYGVWYLRKK